MATLLRKGALFGKFSDEKGSATLEGWTTSARCTDQLCRWGREGSWKPPEKVALAWTLRVESGS
jgi:hypothetical protein